MSLKLHMPFILWILIETLWLPVFKNKISHSCPGVYFLSLLLTSQLLLYISMYACVHTQLLQLCLTLCDPKDCSLPDISVHGISQSIILEWIAIFSSRRYSWPRNWTCLSCLAGRFFTTELPGKPLYIYKSLHICIYIHISMLCEAIHISVYPHNTHVYIYTYVCVRVWTECFYSSWDDADIIQISVYVNIYWTIINSLYRYILIINILICLLSTSSN